MFVNYLTVTCGWLWFHYDSDNVNTWGSFVERSYIFESDIPTPDLLSCFLVVTQPLKNLCWLICILDLVIPLMQWKTVESTLCYDWYIIGSQ